VLASCSANVGMMSTRNIDYSATYVKSGKAYHKASFAMVFVFPVAFDDMNLVEVVDQALMSQGYELMTGIELKGLVVPIPYIFTYASVEVSGTGWKVQDATAQADDASEKPMYSVKQENGEYTFERIAGYHDITP
jgi:hypothetical protein